MSRYSALPERDMHHVAAHAQQAAADFLPEPKREKSKGHRSAGNYMFDASVYGGLNYFVNGAISIALAHYAKRMPTSRIGKSFQSTKNGITDALKKVSQTEEWAAKYGKEANEFMWLGTGGFILLLPIKWIEDVKPELVRYFDNTFGTGPKTANQQYEYDQYLDDAPKQSYGSLIGGRCLALAGTIGTTTALSGAMAPYFKDIRNALGPVYEKVLPKRAAVSVAGLTSRELFSCAVGTTLLYGFSKGIAYYNHYYRDQRPEQARAQSPAPTTRIEAGAHDRMPMQAANMPALRAASA